MRASEHTKLQAEVVNLVAEPLHTVREACGVDLEVARPRVAMRCRPATGSFFGAAVTNAAGR
eukprot:COSAG03_NODE_2964_length_2321_cov_3.036904_3_plen_62_part_00